MKYITKYIMSLLLTLLCASCQDDMFSEMENVVSQPGQYNLSLEMMFAPEEGVELNSRTAGDRISDISNLYIALFDKQGEYVDHWYFSEDNPSWSKVTISKAIAGSETETDPDPICKVTTNISVPYNGEPMHLVAVANMGDVSNDYTNLTEFRAIEFPWDRSWGPNSNRQMSGYFTTTKESAPRGTKELNVDGGIPTITLKGGVTTLHAWLRRAASKVTVDFDASGLRENIWIYIKDVRVRDIPRSCTVFNTNQPDSEEKLFCAEDDGETLDYSKNNSDWRTWPSLSKSKTNLSDINPDAHGIASPSLFFFENMQGEGKDKAQIVAGSNSSTPTYPNGGTPGNEGYKDDKPYGTYVEVNGYYYSTADNNVNSGEITYRFMLGKNVTTDYNVERNHHYKLTLVFNGNANDVDWHIDYKYDKDHYIPETYYISYLYGQRMHLPITIRNLEKIMPSKGKDGYVKISAKILNSNWYPDPPATKGSAENAIITEDYYDEDKVNPNHKGPHTGFLSLHSNEYSRLKKNNYVGRGKSATLNYLKLYWNGKTEENSDSLGVRSFKVPYQTKTYLDTEKDIYQVTTDDNKQDMVFYMPLYTRALFLVKEWSYTGNNPYEEFTRSSQVKITIEVYTKNGTTEKRVRKSIDTINIVQVPRIFNPKGVYRQSGNNAPFEVTLMQAVKGSKGTKYESFLSKGPWSAQIESASENSKISIDGQKAVFGSTDSPISFNINFSSSANASKNQYAIILVRYHNYTCNHRIIVRQGYKPEIVSKDSSTKWHCFNLRTGGMEAESPIESGSLFKYGNLNDAISEANILPKYFNSPANSETPRKLTVMDKEGVESKKAYTKILPSNFPAATAGYFPGTNNGKVTLNNGKKNARIAFGKDFEALRDNDDTEYGYGICYADGATTTATVGVAGGSYYYSNEATHHLGTLGCFIYSKDISNNIFLPAGRTGFGDLAIDGSVRYGGPSKSLANPQHRPLLWRLYQNYGVNYWLGDRVYTVDPWNTALTGYATGWDINISSFDFNTYFANGNAKTKDETEYVARYDASKAFPIRLVE